MFTRTTAQVDKFYIQNSTKPQMEQLHALLADQFGTSFVDNKSTKGKSKNLHLSGSARQISKAAILIAKIYINPAYRPIDFHRIFLQGLPDDIDEEKLLLFIEGRTGISNKPSITYGEEPGTAMLLYKRPILGNYEE